MKRIVTLRSNYRLKIRIYRLFIQYKQNLKKKITKYNGMQERGIQLWNIYLKHSDTQLYSSIRSNARQIERDNVMMSLHQVGDNYVLSIMDVTPNRSHCFEVIMSMDHVNLIADEFDKEMQRRMRAAELSKRNLLLTDLDILLSDARISLAGV